MTIFSIETRTLASKELRFKTVIIAKNKGVIIHRESKTFKKKDLDSDIKPLIGKAPKLGAKFTVPLQIQSK